MMPGIILTAFISYLLGSLNSSIIVGRMYGKDIRKYGSGNAGLTNTARVLGKKAAIMVLIGDALKAVISCIIASLIIKDAAFNPYIIGALFAVIGHNWPVYFRFKGGKGALTAVAAAFMIDPLSAGILLLVFLTVLILFRYVSLSTIITGLLYPVVSYLLLHDSYIFLYTLTVTAIIIFKHHANIKRLISGTESKVKFAKGKS